MESKTEFIMGEEVSIWQVGKDLSIPADISCAKAPVWPEYEKAVTAQREERLIELAKEGRQLVHEIYVRKGNQLLMNKAGTRMKPMAQTIFSKNMAKLKAGVPVAEIISDLESQLKLL